MSYTTNFDLKIDEKQVEADLEAVQIIAVTVH